MISSTMRGSRRGRWLLAPGAFVGAMLASAPALAQGVPGTMGQPAPAGSGAELRRHLNTLAENPRSLSALIGAGRAALDAGDPQASLSFFGRADEISPSDARVKAGMASALVHLEQAEAALRLFAEAVSLGAPEAEIAGDRGLAHDTLGDPRRAQQDYTIALRHRENSEIRRRLALSLAISGQRDPALRLIDAQLRRHDRAAWRTQAFVLALTGDVAGANRAAQSVMPVGAVQAMAPFLARLSGLSPGQKARAVHFGHFPSDGRAMASSADTRPDPGALAMAGGVPQPAQTASQPQRPIVTPVASAPRRRPGSAEEVVERVGPGSRPLGPTQSRRREAAAQRRTVQVARAEPRPIAPTPVPAQSQRAPALQPPSSQPAPQLQPSGTRFQPVTQTASQATVPVQQPSPSPSTPTRFQPATAAPQPAPFVAQSSTTPGAVTTDLPRQDASPPAASVATTRIPPSQLQALPVEREAAQVIASASGFSQPQPGVPASTEPSSASVGSLADIASVVNSLREEPAPTVTSSRPRAETSIGVAPRSPTPSQTPPSPRPRSATDRTSSATPSRARATQPAHPTRHWVQIAGGADRTALPRELARLRGLAPQQLANRAAYTTPLRATNRLLVGPFPSVEEAQQFVNALAQRNIAAFAWTSPAGQEIERLAR